VNALFNSSPNSERIHESSNIDTNSKFIYTIPSIIEPNLIDCIFPETEELGGLYISGLDGAANANLLRKLKIRAVLTSSVETPIKYAESLIYFHEGKKKS